MFKELIETLRKRNYPEVKKILAKNPLYNLSQEDRMWVSSSTGLDSERSGYSTLMHSQWVILTSTIIDHVHTPDIIHELLVAGCSPLLIACAFWEDEYRFNMLLRLLPRLDSKLSISPGLEEQITRGVDSIDGSRNYDLRDPITYEIPNFPVLYQNYTYDFQQLTKNLIDGTQFGIGTNANEELSSLLHAANATRRANRLPELGRQDNEYNELLKKAKKIASKNRDEALHNVLFAAEVYAAIKEQNVPLMSIMHESAVARALYERFRNINIFDIVAAIYLLVCVTLTEPLFSITDKTHVKFFFAIIVGLPFAELYNLDYIGEDRNNRRSFYWLYNECERYPYAKKSATLLADIRSRHAKCLSDEKEVPKQLYFWSKILADKNMDNKLDIEVADSSIGQRPKID